MGYKFVFLLRLLFASRSGARLTSTSFVLVASTAREDLLRSGNTWFERQRSALKEVLLPLQVSKDEAVARAAKSEQSLAVLKEDLSNKASDLAEKSNRVGYLEEESVKKGE